MPHFKIPGYVKLEKFVSEEALDSLYRVCWMALDDASPVRLQIQGRLPDEELGERNRRVMAVKEFAALVWEALQRKRGEG